MAFFLAYLVAACAVGVMAQIWKRRTGVLWGLLTFPAFWFWWLVAIRVPTAGAESPEMLAAVNATFAALFGAGTMAIIVASLPRRPVVEVDNPRRPLDRDAQLAEQRRDWLAEVAARNTAGSEKKCPMCAELVKAEAQICRFCGHQFAAQQTAQLAARRLTGP